MIYSAKHLPWIILIAMGACTFFTYASSEQALCRHKKYDLFSAHQSTQRPHNAASCAECHAIPVEGGSSRVTVTQLGRRIDGKYMGFGVSGTLHLHDEGNVNTEGWIKGLRVVPNTLGDGYVEAIPEKELRQLAERESKETHGRIHGELITVTVPGAKKGTKAVGRFGWKDQHATLLSAAAQALRDELGIPNRHFSFNNGNKYPSPNTVNKQSVATSEELTELVRFLRSTEPIAPDPQRSALDAVKAGSKLFNQIGCFICHTPTLHTAPAGTKLDGGTVIVSQRLGNRVIHPYSDFLLHDVGTGDGIVENIYPQDYNESTANKFRTPPLWGVRYRTWMMHDGKSITYHQAIMRHRGEATEVVKRYEALTPVQQQELREFLNSL